MSDLVAHPFQTGFLFGLGVFAALFCYQIASGFGQAFIRSFNAARKAAAERREGRPAP